MDVGVAVIALLVLLGPSCTNSDNYALLANTLKTLQRVACDEETISLACPWGTFISIYSAKYSKVSSAANSCIMSPNLGLEGAGNENCLWPNNMQYSLLQTVVEACQKKPQCKFNIKPKPDQVDPCPFARKFVEVGYKCRPTEFRSQSVCRDDIIRLSCNPRSRIAIYEAKYGRTAYETITCPQPRGLKDETCAAPLVTEKIMKICHGKRRCEITANEKTFGSPCKPGSMTYLKLYYTCVPLGVLKKKYETAAEKDEVLNGIEGNQDGNLFDDDSDGSNDRIWDDMNAISPIADPALQPLPKEFEEPITANGSSSDFHEKINNSNSKTNLNILIYISISIAITIVCMIIVITIRCIIIRRKSNNSKTGDMFTTEPPNVFNDAVSDVDNDIDVSHISGTYYDHPDMILYREAPNRGIRAMRPLTTIYPSAGVNMYGVDYVPSRDVRYKEQSDVIMSPKSLGECSSSYYG